MPKHTPIRIENPRKPRADRGFLRGPYRKRQQKPEPEPEEQQEDLPQEFDEETGEFVERRADPLVLQSEDEIDAIVGDLTMSGGKVKLSYKHPNTPSYAYLTEIPVRDFNLENIKSIFGGGKFSADFVTLQGTCHRRGVLFEIAGPFRGTMEEQEAARAKAANGTVNTSTTIANVGPSTGHDMSMAQLFAMQQQRSDQFLALLMNQQEKMMAVFAQIAGHQKSDLSSLSPLLAPVLAELAKSRQPSYGAMETIETLRAAKSLLMERRDDDESGFEKLISLAAPALASMVRPAPAALPGPAPLPAPAASGPPGPTLNAAQLRMVFPMLHRAAQNGTDPNSYADVIEDLLSDADWQVFEDALRQPNWSTLIFGIEQLPFRPWFEQLRQSLLDESLQPEDKGNEQQQQPTQQAT